jgi:hypothetical protein
MRQLTADAEDVSLSSGDNCDHNLYEQVELKLQKLGVNYSRILRT